MQLSISTELERIGRLASSPPVWDGIFICFRSHLNLVNFNFLSHEIGIRVLVSVHGCEDQKRMVLLKLKKFKNVEPI